MNERKPPVISAVVPVYNEQDNVVPLYEEIRQVIEQIGEPFEVLFVNDGSTDDTRARLAAIGVRDPRLRLIDLDGNFGEASALSAGFHQARGAIVVTLDGDGQNDPADIPRLLARLRDGNLQVVSGRRARRQEGFWLRVLPSRVANAMIAWVTGVPVYDTGCGLKAYRREAIPRLHIPRGLHRFLPAVFGVRPQDVAEVETVDRCRQHGTSHYGLTRLFAVLRDLLALPFILRDSRQAEVRFALATAAAAAIGAVVLEMSWVATAVFDLIAVLLGTIWWNARRFNRAQTDGVYRIRQSEP